MIHSKFFIHECELQYKDKPLEFNFLNKKLCKNQPCFSTYFRLSLQRHRPAPCVYRGYALECVTRGVAQAWVVLHGMLVLA